MINFEQWEGCEGRIWKEEVNAVSYTHLDVYKRQVQNDHVLLAAGQVHVAVLFHPGNVAGVEPAVCIDDFCKMCIRDRFCRAPAGPGSWR